MRPPPTDSRSAAGRSHPPLGPQQPDGGALDLRRVVLRAPPPPRPRPAPPPPHPAPPPRTFTAEARRRSRSSSCWCSLCSSLPLCSSFCFSSSLTGKERARSAAVGLWGAGGAGSLRGLCLSRSSRTCSWEPVARTGCLRPRTPPRCRSGRAARTSPTVPLLRVGAQNSLRRAPRGWAWRQGCPLPLPEEVLPVLWVT